MRGRVFEHRDSEEMNINIQKMRCLIDFVQVTIPELDENVALDMLEMNRGDFIELDRGMMGYRKQLRCKHIVVLYDGSENMGVHIVMSGQGCREYEQRMFEKYKDLESILLWKKFVQSVFDLRGKFTRLDLAIDDFNPHFTVEDVYKKLKKDHVTSRFKGYRLVESGSIRQDQDQPGMTLYFGSSSSNIEIVFYDKYREREAAGHEVDQDVQAWNRVEIRLYDKNTHSASVNILYSEDLGRIAKSILYSYIEIHESNSDSNVTRRRLWRKYSKFLGDVDKLKLSHVAPDRSIEKSKEWIDRQVKKTLGKLFVADDGNFEQLHKWIAEGMEMLDQDDLIDIREYQKRKDFKEFFRDDIVSDEIREMIQKVIEKEKELMPGINSEKGNSN